MSVLSDKDLKAAILQGELSIQPLNMETQIQPASIDLTLGIQFKQLQALPVDTRQEPPTAESYVVLPETAVTINPGEFLLATTREHVQIPDNMIARVEGRSSLARLGLAVHVTAGFIDPGFTGQITLEIANHSPAPIAIYPGQRICQIVIEQLSSPAEHPYAGKYQHQTGPTTSKIQEDTL